MNIEIYIINIRNRQTTGQNVTMFIFRKKEIIKDITKLWNR